MVIKTKLLSLVLVSNLLLSACASSDQKYVSDIYDPLEPYNRTVFAFNDGLDTVLLDPLTEAYRLVMPSPFRMVVSNFLQNLKSPVYLANELLQGDLDDAQLVTTRFVLNTFTGFGGLLDTASWEGMTYEGEDFGQTLASWGVGSGAYLVLPILGPSTVRDGFGLSVDYAMDPINWYAWNNEGTDVDTVIFGVTALDTKDQVMDLQHDLKSSSLDYYAAVRSVWMQRRMALINDGAELTYEEY